MIGPLGRSADARADGRRTDNEKYDDARSLLYIYTESDYCLRKYEMKNKLRDNELGLEWVLFAAFAIVAVVTTITLLVVYDKLPEQFITGPGNDVDILILGINFFEPFFWSTTIFALFAFNIFSSMLQKKLVLWQWKIISNGGFIDDAKTWGIMTMNETLNSTLGFATFFFSAINVYFLLSSALGRTVGVMLVAYTNGEKKTLDGKK